MCWSLADNCGFDEIFWAIGLSGVVVVEPVLLAVGDPVVFVLGVVAPLEEVADVVGAVACGLPCGVVGDVCGVPCVVSGTV